MSTPSEGRVEIDAGWVGQQLVDRLAFEHGSMPAAARGWRPAGNRFELRRHPPSEREVGRRRGQSIGQCDALVFGESRRVPQFEVRAHAKQHDLALELCRGA